MIPSLGSLKFLFKSQHPQLTFIFIFFIRENNKDNGLECIKIFIKYNKNFMLIIDRKKKWALNY